MKTVYVQFSDGTETAISSVFDYAQDESQWKNQGQIPSDDPRYKAFYNSLSPLVQQSMITPGT